MAVGGVDGVGAGYTLGIAGGNGDDGHVGQLAVVGRSERIQADEIQGVGVHVVTGDHGDDGGGVVGLDVAVVVGAHVGETLGVLVDEGGVGDGVVTGEVAVEDEGGGGTGVLAHLGLAGGVVGPVGGDGRVLGGEEEHLDGVGEADVVADGDVGGEALLGSGLHLLDEDITGSTGHALTLVVGHDGVVGPHLGVVGNGDGGGGGEIGGDHHGAGGLDVELGRGGAVGGVHIPDVEEIGEVAEREEDAHVVVGKRGGGESDTRVPGVEEGKGEVEGLGGEDQGGINELGDVTDHVVVTHLLAGGGRKGGPEIKVEVIETSGDKIVEGDAALADKVVHEIGRPGDVLLVQVISLTTLNLLGAAGGAGHGGGGEGGDGHTKPGVEEVITRTGDGDGPVVTKVGGTRGTGETHGHLGEPGSTARLADKVGRSILTTVHVLFKLIVGSKINEPRRKIRGTILRHFLIQKGYLKT